MHYKGCKFGDGEELVGSSGTWEAAVDEVAAELVEVGTVQVESSRLVVLVEVAAVVYCCGEVQEILHLSCGRE